MHARVEPSVMRVAGDSRGTASTLVGLTPEEEMARRRGCKEWGHGGGRPWGDGGEGPASAATIGATRWPSRWA